MKSRKQTPTLMQLAEELSGISLLESGTVNPFFLLAKKREAFQIPVNFSTQEQYQFTSVKIAAILQSQKCNHYTFTTRIQFKAKAGDKEVMKQQVLILFAEKDKGKKYACHAKLYNLKLNKTLERPQLDLQQTLEDFDGQFSNLFEAPIVPDDLAKELAVDIEQYLYNRPEENNTIH